MAAWCEHQDTPRSPLAPTSLARSLQLFVIAAPSPRIPYLSVLLLAPYPCGSYLPNHLSLFLGLFIPCHDSASSNTTCVFLLLVRSLWMWVCGCAQCSSVAEGVEAAKILHCPSFATAAILVCSPFLPNRPRTGLHGHGRRFTPSEPAQTRIPESLILCAHRFQWKPMAITIATMMRCENHELWRCT